MTHTIYYLQRIMGDVLSIKYLHQCLIPGQETVCGAYSNVNWHATNVGSITHCECLRVLSDEGINIVIEHIEHECRFALGQVGEIVVDCWHIGIDRTKELRILKGKAQCPHATHRGALYRASSFSGYGAIRRVDIRNEFSNERAVDHLYAIHGAAGDGVSIFAVSETIDTHKDSGLQPRLIRIDEKTKGIFVTAHAVQDIDDWEALIRIGEVLGRQVDIVADINSDDVAVI